MDERILYGREDDLVHNRAGRLSPRQADLTARPLRWAALALLLSSTISLLVGLGVPLLFGLEASTRLLIGAVVGTLTLVELLAAWRVWRAAQQLSTRPIEIAEGRLERLTRGASGSLPPQMNLGGRIITIPQPNLPLRAGTRYRAYGLPRRNVMMTYTLVELEDNL